MKRMNLKKSLVALSCLALFSCGSEDVENTFIPPESNSPSNSVTAYDKVAAAPINTPVSIDLSSYVSGDDVVIDDISSDTPEYCYSYVDSLKSVKVEIAKLGRCRYTYVAENAAGETAQGKIELISSKEVNPFLDAISISYTLDKLLDESNEIDLSDYLTIPDSYQFDPDEFVIESQSGSNAIEAKVSESDSLTLHFSKENGAVWKMGWHRIGYQLINEAKTSLLEGEIFISISDEINQPPVITPPLFSHANIKATIGELTTFDLSAMQDLEISDPDNHSWRLSHVSVMSGANVALVSEDNLYNRSFTFKTQIPGTHDVSYIITDNKGASSMGVLHVHAEGDLIYQGMIWGDLSESNNACREGSTSDPKCFTAPRTAEEASTEPAQRKPAIPNDLKVFIDVIKEKLFAVNTWTKSVGEAYCTDHYARLPTVKELKNLSKRDGFEYWPKGLPYLAKGVNSDDDDDDDDRFSAKDSSTPKYKVVYIQDDTTLDYEEGTNVYLTCAARNY